MKTNTDRPITHREEVALFRHSIVGDLLAANLEHGELVSELKQRADRHYRPPGSAETRRYRWKTLQRWLAASRRGFKNLYSAERTRGFAQAVTDEARDVLLDMRREFPHVASDILLDEAVTNGVISADTVSPATVRRLFAREGLSRVGQSRPEAKAQRRKWEADRVCRVWHADVCHLWMRDEKGGMTKAFVHGILDDHSRYAVALRACERETENDLLEVLVEALMRYPAPEVLYVDNGSTYRGELLTLAGAELGIRVVHAKPYDPEARGKMERFWRTMRQRLWSTATPGPDLQGTNAALLSWLDADYHQQKHGGLMGVTPKVRFKEGLRDLAPPLTIEEIARALVVKRTAKVKKDATFSVDGTLYEVTGRHLAGQVLTLGLDPFTGKVIHAQHDGQPVVFAACDPTANAQRGRAAAPTDRETREPSKKRFDRISSLLAAARKVTDA